MAYLVDEARLHLGGAIHGGDPATQYPVLWRWLVEEYQIRSVLDVGCGEGHAVEFFKEEGCTVLGVDGIPPAGEHYFAWDYTQGPMPPTQRFDLCWSCEFVEHVEERFLPNFVASFAHCDYVLMTHAAPGQPGYHHVNCRDSEYWKGVMAGAGFWFNEPFTALTRELAAENEHPLNHYAQRGLAFERY